MNVGTYNKAPLDNTILLHYSNALVNIPHVIVMPDLNQIFYVSKAYHIKMHLQLNPIPPLPYNSLSSHTIMADSPHKKLPKKQTNINHL
jgi:hypothetical protein